MPPALLEEPRHRYLPTRDHGAALRVVVRGNADGHDALLVSVEQSELVQVVVEPPHGVLDGDVQVPEGIRLGHLNASPDERVDPGQHNEKLVYEYPRRVCGNARPATDP